MAPTPSTPLSGCPLKRLDIHDRLAVKVYDAALSEASLTLSLQGQRSPSGDRNDLVLQAHHGLQRVSSFQLTDLLNSPNGKTDAISVDRASQQLCVTSQQHSQRLLATLSEARDFNVAACMLKKFGFLVKDGILPPSQPLSNQNPSPMAGTGPRLSSITPLSWPGVHDPPPGASDLSFASMLNSTVPLPGPTAPYGRLSSVPSMSSHPYSPPLVPFTTQPVALPYGHHVLPQTAYHSPFNPYHVFLGGQFHQPHQPLVGSPLRHSFSVEGTPDSMTMPVMENPVYSVHPRLGMLQDGRSISVPVVPHVLDGSQGSQLSQVSQPSPDFQSSQTPPAIASAQGAYSSSQGSQDASQFSSCEGFSQSSLESIDRSQEKMKQDIRDLMPQPRELPFAQQGKKKPGKKKPIPSTIGKPQPKLKPIPRSRQRPKPEGKDGPKGETRAPQIAKPTEDEADPIVKAKVTAKAKVPVKKAPSKKPAKNVSMSASKSAAGENSAAKARPKPAEKSKALTMMTAKAKPKSAKNSRASAMVPAQARAKATTKPQPKPKSKPKPKPAAPKQTQANHQKDESRKKEKDVEVAKDSKPPTKRTKRPAPRNTEPNANRRKRSKKDPPSSSLSSSPSRPPPPPPPHQQQPPTPKQASQTPAGPDPASSQPAPSQRTRQDSTSPSAPTATPAPSTDPPRVAIAPPTMLLTDHDALGESLQITSKLLKQYEDDIARGEHETGLYARFYAGRIHSARREFWAAKLAEAADQRHMVLFDA